MGKAITGVLVKTDGELEAVTIHNALDAYYGLLGCDIIDCTVRRIGGNEYDIICDDEGLFKDKPVVTAVTKNYQPALVGNLFICNHDDEGNWTSLSEDEIEEIKGNTVYVFDNEYGIREVVQIWN